MIGNDWDEILEKEFNKKYFIKLKSFIDKEYKTKKIYPSKKDLFAPFKYSSYENTKVVILGGEPYHGKDLSDGLAFSVKNGLEKSPTLENILMELKNDLKIPFPVNNSLVPWAKEGVLLLNEVLTVEENSPNSHKGKGWEEFTDNIIKLLNKKKTAVVFILWGNSAREKKKFITNKNHLVIGSAHPSPFSANSGFFGSKPFSKTNEFLKSNGLKEINWKIE